MLKGHVFKQQIFGNQIFALFINTFLGGKNGISNDYKNAMEVNTSGSTLTVNSGVVCIQGRFLEEDTNTSLEVGTDTMYCKLVIEIDLSKKNTSTEFVQGSYKIVKSTTSYPELAQNDIIKNNTGTYQYELARFKTGINGITEFQDMRTFLDFNSIYAAIQEEYRSVLQELQQELQKEKDNSLYALKEDVTGTVLYSDENGFNDEKVDLNDSTKNYKYVEIRCVDGDKILTTGKVLLSYGNAAVVHSISSQRQTVAVVYISDNSVSKGYEYSTNYGSTSISRTKNISIVEVVGYKN